MAIPFDDILCSWNLIINCTVMALIIIVILMREDIVIEYKLKTNWSVLPKMTFFLL